MASERTKNIMDDMIKYFRMYAGTSPKSMVRKIALEDKNNDRKFQLEELEGLVNRAVQAVTKGKKKIPEEDIRWVFRALDQDGNRWIDSGEFVQLFRRMFSGRDLEVFEREIRRVISEGDEENVPANAN